jgi:hypothetical protein
LRTACTPPPRVATDADAGTCDAYTVDAIAWYRRMGLICSTEKLDRPVMPVAGFPLSAPTVVAKAALLGAMTVYVPPSARVVSKAATRPFALVPPSGSESATTSAAVRLDSDGVVVARSVMLGSSTPLTRCTTPFEAKMLAVVTFVPSMVTPLEPRTADTVPPRVGTFAAVVGTCDARMRFGATW